MKVFLILFVLSFFNLSANDYYSIIDNNSKIGKFHYISQNDRIYKNNSIYIKTNRVESVENVESKVREIIRRNNINDFSIVELKRPFAKFENELLRSNNLNKIVNIKFSSSHSSWIISKILQESGEFSYVIPERIYKFSEINSNDPLNNKTVYLDSLKANEIWELAKGDSSISIGIVDSGVMIDHEDLNKTLKINHNEIPNDGKDNDNNGFIDDYFGWDFVGDVNATELFSGNLKPDNDVVPNNKYNNHGTHVTGIACAESNNNKGISSLGYALSYIPVKVSADDITQLNYVEKPFEGILYALDRGADVINCSWLDDDYNPLAQDVIDEVVSRGSVVVCAAGNEGLDNFNYPFIAPASLRNVISVGASNINNTPASFSDYGWNVDLFAPGVSIYSTILENKYDNKSGTSMSTPVVSSLVGILKKLHPNWSFKQIELQLRANVNKFKEFANNDTSRYWGYINALSAVKNNYLTNFSNPGLTIKEYFLDSSIFVEELDKVYGFNLILENQLAAASNINIELIPLVDYIEINNKYFSINSLGNNESKSFKLDFQLNRFTPYFQGVIPILVLIKSQNYINLEIIEIPYTIESSTKFLAAQYFDNYLDNMWIDAKSPSKYSLWAIGKRYSNGRGIIYSYGKSFDVLNTTKNATAIFPFNDKNAIVAFKSDNPNENSEVSITENAGLTFKSITKPLSEIYDIHFFNDNNGLIIGSNNQSYLGILTSKDGGNSWAKAPLIPAENNERIIKYNYKNNSSILITNIGNLYFSDSMGSDWSKIASYSVANDSSNLLLSFNQTIALISYQNNEFIFNYSLDSAKNWLTNKVKLPNKVIKAFFLENSEIVYLLLEKGQIIYSSDYFKNWNYILNEDSKFGNLDLGAVFIDSCGIRLWQLAYNLYFSDIENVDTTEKKYIEIAGSDHFNFDSLKINEKSQSQILFSTNTGRAFVEIDGQNFSKFSQSSYILEKKFSKYISPCQLYDAKIRFEPKTSGWHFDTLTISSNSDNQEIRYYLSGYAYDPTSVKNELENNILIFPNPAIDFVTIYSPRDTKQIDNGLTDKIEIYNVIGELQYSSSLENMTTMYKIHRIDVSNLATGIYLLKIGNKVEKFLKF